VIATADADLALAREAAQAVAARVWEQRAAFAVRDPEAVEVVAEALALQDGRPVVIGDFPDNPGGGSPGDATHLLRALITSGADRLCLAAMIDPITAAQARVAGEGATIDVVLGGRGSPFGGDPIVAPARVERLTDGRVRLTGPFAQNSVLDYGPSARLHIGGVDVVVASNRTQVFDPEVFLLHGIDPAKYQVVGVKSANHFRSGFGPIAGRILTMGGPGLISPSLETFPAPQQRGPRFPLDPALTWSPTPCRDGGIPQA
jgi:microcystin degradation protein MlrC